jgi:hypothetical protein
MRSLLPCILLLTLACARPVVQPARPVAHPIVDQPVAAPPPVAQPLLVAPPAPLQPKAIAMPQTIVLPWGAGPGQVAHSQPSEGNPEAPMSFRVAKDGALWILDQLNQRVTVIHVDAAGKIINVEPNRPATLTTQDLLLTPDEKGLWLLDRLVAKKATLLDAQTGHKLAEASLPEPSGGITGLFAFDGGLYVEMAHEKLQRIALLDGKPAGADVLNGRPSQDGKFAVRVVKSKDGVLVTAHNLRNDAAALWSWQPKLAVAPQRIAGLDVGRDGATWLTVCAGNGSCVVAMRQADGQHEQTVAVDLAGPYEQFHTSAVGDDGRFHTATATAAGFAVQGWTP